jgi:hypothetical protein
MMKRMTGIVIMCSAVFLFHADRARAEVDMEMFKVSNTLNFPSAGRGTLVVDLYMGADDIHLKIIRLAGSFQLSSDFQNVSVSFPYFQFSTSDYNYDLDYNGTTRIVSFTSELKDGLPWPSGLGIGGDWERVLTASIEYDMTSNHGMIQWAYSPAFDAAGKNEYSPFQVIDPWNGTLLPIPSELQDISLPVEFTNFITRYDDRDGVTLWWVTESETDCAGFNILRSDEASGSYLKINPHLIAGHGTASERHEYAFLDGRVVKGKVYTYKIEEVDIDGKKMHYGPATVIAESSPTNEGVPLEYVLLQNYPNPFNPITTVKYRLPEDSQVSIQIFDELGRQIRTLAQPFREKGTYTVLWDGRNDLGEIVDSGVYMLKLAAGNKVLVRKMTFLK